jgi:hypothetical protein
MTKYKLKKGTPGFQVTDGHMKGHVFEMDMVYVAVPDKYLDRFEPVTVPAPGHDPDETGTQKGRRAKS